MNKSVCLSTERLILRGICCDDAVQIVAWRNDPANFAMFERAAPITLDRHMEWFEGYLKDNSRLDMLIFTKTGEAIGTVGLSGIDSGCAWVNYMIGSENARGCGYAREAVEGLLRYGRSEFDLDIVRARIRSSNRPSQSLATRLGFEVEWLEYVLKIGEEDDTF